VHAAGGVVLLDEQPGDEIAGEGEEPDHADVARIDGPVVAVGPQVIGDHAENEKGSHAVEGGGARGREPSSRWVVHVAIHTPASVSDLWPRWD